MRSSHFSLLLLVVAAACSNSNGDVIQGLDGGGGDAKSNPDGGLGPDGGGRHDGAVGKDGATDGSKSDAPPADACTDDACVTLCTTKPERLAPADNVWDVAVNATDAFFVVPGETSACTPPVEDGGIVDAAGFDAECDGGSTPGAIVQVPITGGTSVVLSRPALPNGLVLGGGFAIFSDQNGGIFTVPIGGGTTTMIAPTASSPTRPVTDGTTVYFADGASVRSVPIGGGTVSTLLSGPDAAQVEAVGVVGTNLILAANGAEIVWSIPLSGGAVTTLAEDQQFPLFPLSAAGKVAWINSGDAIKTGAIMEIESGKPTQIATGPGLTFPTFMTYEQGTFYVVTGGGGFGPVGTVSEGSGAISSVKGTQASGGVAVLGQCLYYGSVFVKPPGLYVVHK
jgi:hypothetical protein